MLLYSSETLWERLGLYEYEYGKEVVCCEICPSIGLFTTDDSFGLSCLVIGKPIKGVSRFR